MSELLEGLFRSPRFIQRANGPHEVRYVPPHPFACCGLAGDKARLGAPGLAGEKSGLFEHPAEAFSYCPRCADHRCSAIPIWFFRSLLYNGCENARTRSLSDSDRSTVANDPQPSASFSARKNPRCIPANTPPVFPGLRPCIWPHLLRLVTNGNVGQAPCSRGRPHQVDSPRRPGVRFARSSAHNRQMEALWIPQLGPAMPAAPPALRL